MHNPCDFIEGVNLIPCTLSTIFVDCVTARHVWYCTYMNKLNKYGAFNIIKLRHILTPIAMDKIQFTDDGASFMAYASLYVFGVRIARWRTAPF